jgi:hypothetical protein
MAEQGIDIPIREEGADEAAESLGKLEKALGNVDRAAKASTPTQRSAAQATTQVSQAAAKATPNVSRSASAFSALTRQAAITAPAMGSVGTALAAAATAASSFAGALGPVGLALAGVTTAVSLLAIAFRDNETDALAAASATREYTISLDELIRKRQEQERIESRLQRVRSGAETAEEARAVADQQAEALRAVENNFRQLAREAGATDAVLDQVLGSGGTADKGVQILVSSTRGLSRNADAQDLLRRTLSAYRAQQEEVNRTVERANQLSQEKARLDLEEAEANLEHEQQTISRRQEQERASEATRRATEARRRLIEGIRDESEAIREQMAVDPIGGLERFIAAQERWNAVRNRGREVAQAVKASEGAITAALQMQERARQKVADQEVQRLRLVQGEFTRLQSEFLRDAEQMQSETARMAREQLESLRFDAGPFAERSELLRQEQEQIVELLNSLEGINGAEMTRLELMHRQREILHEQASEIKTSVQPQLDNVVSSLQVSLRLMSDQKASFAEAAKTALATFLQSFATEQAFKGAENLAEAISLTFTNPPAAGTKYVAAAKHFALAGAAGGASMAIPTGGAQAQPQAQPTPMQGGGESGGGGTTIVNINSHVSEQDLGRMNYRAQREAERRFGDAA